jgi:hypothetical protein
MAAGIFSGVYMFKTVMHQVFWPGALLKAK